MKDLYKHISDNRGAYGFLCRHCETRWESLIVTPEIKDTVDRIKKGNNDWFILCGRSGSGKTFLMTLLCIDVIKSGKKPLLITAQNLVNKVNNCPIENRMEKIDYLKDIDLLVIDEIGRTTATQANKALLFEIINHRFNDRKQTCIISNLSYNELFNDRDGFFDEAFARRFEEAGKVYQFKHTFGG